MLDFEVKYVKDPSNAGAQAMLMGGLDGFTHGKRVYYWNVFDVADWN